MTRAEECFRLATRPGDQLRRADHIPTGHSCSYSHEHKGHYSHFELMADTPQEDPKSIPTEEELNKAYVAELLDLNGGKVQFGKVIEGSEGKTVVVLVREPPFLSPEIVLRLTRLT